MQQNHSKKSTAIEAAKDLYWRYGFHGTSMRHLQQAMNMRPGSIYAQFGSKEGVFKAALQRYSEAGLAHLTHQRMVHSSPLSALHGFIKTVVIDNREQAPSPVCMLVKTVSELSDEHPELLAEAQRLLQMMEQEFALLFSEAIRSGELNPHADPQLLAKELQIQLTGLRIYALNCHQPELLTSLIEDWFARLPR